MSENTCIFEKRLLLFMDILGSRNIISNKSNQSLLIKELITLFASNNKSYSENDIVSRSNDCDILLSSKFPNIENLNDLPIFSKAAYIRYSDKLFYITKDSKSCTEIVLTNIELEKFDCDLDIKNLTIGSPKKLTKFDFILIKSITKHTYLKGLKVIEPEISSFSDHIVLSFPFVGDQFDLMANTMGLFQLADWLHYLGLEKGLLMRGAITIGDLYHEKNIITGDALNKAVNIEENISVYPRVVVDNEIISLIPKNKRCFLSKDFDGLTYVSYMNDIRLMEARLRKINLTELILSNLKEHKNDMRKYSKWYWLAYKLRLVGLKFNEISQIK